MSDAEMVENNDDNRGFQIQDGQQLRVGDCICLHPADPEVELYIAEVQKLYRDKEGQKWIRIRWYYRPQDLQHEPRSTPLKDEVYYTNYFDLQQLETVAKCCRVVTKSEYLKLKDEQRRSSTEKSEDDIYFFEYAYLAETGSFTRISESDVHFRRAFKKQKDFDRENGVSIKDLVDALVQLENRLRKDVIPACWTDKRSEWILKVKESKTVQDITQSLLDLENGLQIILSSDGKTNSKSRSAWRKALRGNQNPDSLLQNIEHLKDYVLCRYDGALKKRKRGWTDHENNFDQILQKSEREQLPLLQDFVSEDLDNGSEKYGASIKMGSFYAIDHNNLPPKAPIHLKSIRAVVVREKTEVNVSVKFPSNLSLRNYFGREFYEGAGNNASRQSPQPSQLTLAKTHPALDEQFVMSLRLAERVLAKPISWTEYVQQRQLESFWLVNSNTLRSPDENVAVKTLMLECVQQAKLAISDTDTSCKSAERECPANGSKDRPIASDVEKDGVPIKWGARRKVRFDRKHRRKNEVKLVQYDERSSPEMVSLGIRRRGAPKRQRLTVEEHDVSFDTAGREKDKTNMLKLPRDMQGRWTSDRYRTAQLKLLDIMHEKGAAPGKPILRPALREEARKHIGDTGLLDHLLKHMTDTVITNGERFRRRHNAEGAMEYWLESAGLMEIRKQAGIEDPAWVPPPGWKPGDKLPLNCYGRGMTPSEAEEMKMIREDIVKLKSQLCFPSSMKSTDNMDRKEHYGISAENDGIFNEKLKDMRTEITTLRRDVERIQSKSLEENNHLQLSNLEVPLTDDSQMIPADIPTEKAIQAGSKMSRCSILERVNRLETDTQKFFQDIESNYRSLSAEKKHLQDQIADMSTNLEKMQEDMSEVLKFFAKLKESGATDPNSSQPLAAVGSLSELRTRISNPSSAFSSSTERAENGVRIGENPPFYKLAVYHHADEGPPEQQAGRTGFRVCKPEGTFIWPNMATKPCSRVQIEDVLSPRRSASSYDNTTAMSGSGAVSNGILSQQPEYSSPSKQRTTDRDMISKVATAVTKDFAVDAAISSALTVYRSPSKAETHNSHCKDSANEMEGTQLSLSPSVQTAKPRLISQPCKRPADLVSTYVAHLTSSRLRWAQDFSGQIVPGPPTLPSPAEEMVGSRMSPLLLSQACNSTNPTIGCHVQAPEASGTALSPSSWLALAPPASSAHTNP